MVQNGRHLGSVSEVLGVSQRRKFQNGNRFEKISGSPGRNLKKKKLNTPSICLKALATAMSTSFVTWSIWKSHSLKVMPEASNSLRIAICNYVNNSCLEENQFFGKAFICFNFIQLLGYYLGLVLLEFN